jgi:hypothetical protein
MSCELKRKQRKRLNNSKTLLPLQYRDISKKEFRTLSFDNKHIFYTTAHAINLENHNFRKILYDAFFDALENKYGKIHRRDYLNEIEKFNNRYYQVANSSDLEKIRKWKEYRESLEYQEFLKQVRQIDRLEHRADITISNALAYMYAQHQDRNLIYEAVEAIEEKLKLNKIPEVWSKGAVWFFVNVAFFEQLSFLTKIRKIPIAVDATQFIVNDLGIDIGIELKARKDWWESKFYYDLSDNEKIFYRIYNDVISVSVGETGSVWLAEAARAGTSLALHYGAKVLTNIATLHPTLRALKVASYIMEGVKDVLNKTVLGWIGWQVEVEWSLDGWIQATMHRIGEALYRFTEGELWENAWNFTKLTKSERYELIKDYFSEYKNLYEKLVNYYRSHKPQELKEEIMKALERFNNYGDILGVRERTEKLVNKFFAIWRSFEARFRLHEFYQHAKREYDLLTTYTKQQLKDYSKAIKVYCYTSSEKDAMKVIEKQHKLANTILKRDVATFKKQVLSDLKEKIETSYIQEITFNKLQVVNYINFALEKLETIFDNFIKQKEQIIESMLNKTYDGSINKIIIVDDRHYTGPSTSNSMRYYYQIYGLITYNRTDYKYINWANYVKLTESHFVNTLNVYINCDISIIILDMDYTGKGYRLVYRLTPNYNITFLKKEVAVLRPFSFLTLKDIELLSFSFLTDFKNNENFLINLQDEICINPQQQQTVYTKIMKIYGNKLKYIQRNRCFSVKHDTKYIKRISASNIYNYLYTTQASGFKAMIEQNYSSITNEKETTKKHEYGVEINKLMQYQEYDTQQNCYYVKFRVENKDTFANKNIELEKIVKFKLVYDKETKLRLKRKSKRSKVLCFVSSQI